MNSDCDLERLDVALDRDASDADRAWAEAHLSTCESCRAYAERLSHLDARLAAMSSEMTPIRSLREDIERRIGLDPHRDESGRAAHRSPTSHRVISTGTLWRIAAGVLLFATGYLSGLSRTESTAASTSPAPLNASAASSDAEDAVADVQRSGSALTASLARLAQIGANSAAPAPQAREVALATMRGAAAELVRIVPDRPGVASAYAAIVHEHERRETGNRNVAF
jgi:hypothetical protein